MFKHLAIAASIALMHQQTCALQVADKLKAKPAEKADKGKVKPTDLHHSNTKKFLTFLTDTGKSYDTDEEFSTRMAYFLETDEKISAHNNSKKGSNFKLGHNKLSDMSPEEKKQMHGLVPDTSDSSDKKTKLASEGPLSSDQEPMGSIDWREEGCVTPVADQSGCGSCWAFATTGALEGAYCAQTGILRSFSEQHLIDCVPDTWRCFGGHYSIALPYLQSNEAILEADYLYRSNWYFDTVCMQDKTQGSGVNVDQIIQVTPNDPKALKLALDEAPVAVAVHSGDTFHAYESGIYDDVACDDNVNHAVLLVGYGVSDEGQEYYILKNSWESSWGEEGYMRIAITEGQGICRVNTAPYYVTSKSK